MSKDKETFTPAELDGLTENIKRLETRLAIVGAITEKIESNQYGLCQACGVEIEVDLLSKDPTTVLCQIHTTTPPGLI